MLHEVKAGDTLGTYQKGGTTPEWIAEINASDYRIGEVLCIPIQPDP